MTSKLEFTGERFVPGIDGEIVYEHVHRYAFARALASGRRVLDAACGEGYGSALLAAVATSVTGVDIDLQTVAHARQRYAAIGNLAFADASVTTLPLADASVDMVVSFETIEHLPAAEQPRMLAEFARVLVPNGVLLLSAPNRVEYSEKRGFANPFHLHEHDRAELDALVAVHFAARRYFRQRVWMGSTIWSEAGERSIATATAYAGDANGVTDAQPPEAMYYLVVAGVSESALPQRMADVSLFSDSAESELLRSYSAKREAIRLDAIVGERTAMLDSKTAHVEHLERLVAYREGIIVERDGQLEAQVLRMLQFESRNVDLQARLDQSQAALAAQERISDYRQSWRWWVRLPLRRLRREWQRLRGK